MGGEPVVSFSNGADFVHALLNETYYHVSVQDRSDCYDPQLPLCTKDDYAGFYTDCWDGVRSAFFSKLRPGSCQGGFDLPAPIFNLPCNISCDDGSYLPIGANRCESCPAGTFSIGGGARIEVWKDWPPGISARSYCLGRFNESILPGCAPWQMEDTEYVSGNITHNQVSVVEISFELVRPGHVTFRWKVEAELCSYSDCDGFYARLNGKQVVNFTSVAPWTTSTFELPKGSHVLLLAYSKDFSVSKGADAAFVNLLEVEGMSFADSFCTPCARGKFSPAGAAQCSLCSNNTASNLEGTPDRCETCPSGKYALIGASVCQDRPLCDDTHKETLFSDCDWVNGTFKRYQRQVWIDPHICQGGVGLDRDVLVDCAPCQRGFHRTPGNGDCVGCDNGQALNGDTCVNCPTGTYAHKVFDISRWDTWPDWVHHSTQRPLSATLEHSCEGQGCLGDWRLMGSYVDSGIGHAFPARLILNFTVDVEAIPSYISYNTSFDCPNGCTLSVSNVGPNKTVLRTDFVYGHDGRSFMRLMESGIHSFIFSFDGFANFVTNSAVGVVRISEIRLSGARDGSAFECLPCRNGTASGAGQDFCMRCPPGTYSKGNQSWPCLPCTDNQVSSGWESWNCTECKRGTRANADNTLCVSDCTFSASAQTSFNLQQLDSSSTMYGPLYDLNQHVYYMSLCHKVPFAESPCVDANGDKVDARICQITNEFTGYAVGDLLEFVPFDAAHEREGFNLSFTGGSFCGNGVQRRANVTFMCDPDAGRGFPDVPHGHSNVETTPCMYEFVWSSQYACPVCTERDYVAVVSDCDLSTLKQQVTYVWRERPKRCIGGVDLPPNHEQDCVVSTTSCELGMYAGGDGTVCTPAEPGKFSIGNGERVIIDEAIPLKFENGCQGAGCTPWTVVRGGILKSGLVASTLRTTRTFLRDGQFEFEFKYSGGDNSVFEVRMDDTVILSQKGERIMVAYETLRVPVSKGLHAFEWIVRGGAIATASARDHMVLLRNITFYNSRFAPLTPTECPGGFEQPIFGKAFCSRCKVNTWAAPGTASCQNCPDEQYSLQGARSCTGRDPCAKFVDYELFSTPCSSGQRVEFWDALPPFHCFVSGPDSQKPLNETKTCGPHDCPPGLYLSEAGHCSACPKGMAYVGSKCEAAKAGYAAVPIVSYFSGVSSLPTLGPEWSTNCSGLCGTPGWRVRSSAIESGFHGDEEVDSVLSLRATFTYDGYISFTYTAESDVDGLDFFVDGERQDVFRPSSHSDLVRTEVTKGSHVFMWVYHQTERHEGRVSLSQMILAGVEGGGSEMVRCPAGTYSDVDMSSECKPCARGFANNLDGQTSCQPCPLNQFQPHMGQSSCQTCASGSSTSQKGSTFCSTPCVYSSNGKQWDLSGIGKTLLGPIRSPVLNDGKEYLLQLCEPMQSVGQCSDDYGQPVISYVCELDTMTKTGVSGGSSMTIGLWEGTEQLSLEFFGGSNDGCDAGETRTTRVVFTCNHLAEHVASVNLVYADGPCHRVFEVSALEGCRTCNGTFGLNSNLNSTNLDYSATVGECTSGSRDVTFLRVSPCNGPQVYTQRMSCTSSVQLPWLAVLAVLGVLGLLVAGIIFLCYRNRKIHSQYSMLLSQKDGNPMEDMNSTRSTNSLVESSVDQETPLPETL